MRRRTWAAMLFAVMAAASACDYPALPPLSGASAPPETASFPATPNRNLDVLFVVENSAGGIAAEQSLESNLPKFLYLLNVAYGGLPNLHVGVVTSDLGTSGTDDPQPGAAIPGCSGEGQAGGLQNDGTTMVTGKFIIDVANPDGSRMTNFSGNLSDALSGLLAVGDQGCAFPQPLEAARRALDGNPANAGFLRADARLAVIFVGVDDDCSLAHSTLLSSDTSTLGPLQPFRCTRFGITCDQGGATPDDMNQPGMKTGCRSNDSGQYLTALPRYIAFFKQLKPDPHDVMIGAIVGDPSPVTVEGVANQSTALAASCTWTDSSGASRGARPAVRIAQFAGALPRNDVETVCTADDSVALDAIGAQIDELVGELYCLLRPIAMPPDCQAFDEIDGKETPIPACDTSTTTDCYTLKQNAQCPGQHLFFDIKRSTPPPPNSFAILRCK